MQVVFGENEVVNEWHSFQKSEDMESSILPLLFQGIFSEKPYLCVNCNKYSQNLEDSLNGIENENEEQKKENYHFFKILNLPCNYSVFDSVQEMLGLNYFSQPRQYEQCNSCGQENLNYEPNFQITLFPDLLLISCEYQKIHDKSFEISKIVTVKQGNSFRNGKQGLTYILQGMIIFDEDHFVYAHHLRDDFYRVFNDLEVLLTNILDYSQTYLLIYKQIGKDFEEFELEQNCLGKKQSVQILLQNELKNEIQT